MKRKKLAIGLVSAVLCLGLLAFGVWAAITQTFNFDAQVSFNAEGVYVDIDGSIYRGETYTELHQLTSDESYEVHAKNYVADEAGNRIGNAYVDVWKPADVAFLPTARIVQYRIKFTNKSAEAISVIPSEVTTIPTNVTLAEESSATLYIEPSETAELRMNFTLADSVTTSFSAKSLQMNFDIMKTSDIETNEAWFTMNSTTTTQLDGLTDTYVSAAPRVLRVPETVNGNAVKSTMAGTTSSYAFLNLATATKYLILPNGLESFAEYSLYKRTGLVSVYIPTGVTEIGGYAFYGCTALTSILIPEGVSEIPEYMFYRCTSLISTHIPNNIISIGRNAFNGCTSLTSITIPSSVTSMEDSAFYGCSSLVITVDEANAYYSSLGGGLYDKDKTRLILGARKKIVDDIPSSVTSIGKAAFYNCLSLVSINIPSSVTTISDNAFQGCSSLISITIPSGVTSISAYFFYKCTSLTSITIPSSVTKILGSAFQGCSSLISITIPSGVTSIGLSAFRDCTSLTSITIPSSVASIGQYAFQNCTSLTAITIPSNVTSIKSCAFQGCTSLTSIAIPSNVTNIDTSAFRGCTSLTSITIPNGMKSIGDYAFRGCTSLTSITIPNGVTSIGDYAFYQCTSLAGVYTSEARYLKTIGSSAFENCTSLTSFTIPDGVTGVGKSAFKGCTSLERMTMPFAGASSSGNTFLGYIFGAASYTESNTYVPDSLTTIEIRRTIASNAFYKCVGLSTITIGSSISSIGNYAFYNCRSLTTINYVVGSSITSIGSYAFAYCTSLPEFAVPSGVTSIGSNAFLGCTSLKFIHMQGTALTSSYTLPTTSAGKVWVRSNSASMPTSWTSNTATSITSSSAKLYKYYHQQAAWEK